MNAPKIGQGGEIPMNTRINGLDMLALILMIIGAINWGLIGLTGTNLVSMIFGSGTLLERLVYLLVGLSGLWTAFSLATKGAMSNTFQHRRA